MHSKSLLSEHATKAGVTTCHQQEAGSNRADSPTAICSAISLSHWLPTSDKCSGAEGLSAYEVEHAERSAFDSFLQGYSLI